MTIIRIQKNTKKVKFAVLLKQKFCFVPRGTIVNNFFRYKCSKFNLNNFVFVFLLAKESLKQRE